MHRKYNIYIAERIKENMGTICMKNNGKLMISSGFHYKYHKLYHFFTAHEKNWYVSLIYSIKEIKKEK